MASIRGNDVHSPARGQAIEAGGWVTQLHHPFPGTITRADFCVPTQWVV